MNDQFDSTDVTGMIRMTEMIPTGQQSQDADAPALLETVVRERLALPDETTGDQTGGYDSFAVEGRFCVVRTVSTVRTSPGCYDDDYYGSGQLI